MKALFCAFVALSGSPHPQEPSHPALEGCDRRWSQAAGELGVGALALAVVSGDEVVHRFTWGRRDPERSEPVTKDTVFYIASATKPFVAFALMQCVEEGLLDLDRPVRATLPRFQLADEKASAAITVRDLLCHAPGLNSFPIVFLDAYTGEITEERYYHFLAQVQPLGRPSYSNLHFTLAGRVLEALRGKPWRDVLAERVFAPAGMTRTSGHASWMYAQDDVALPAVEEDGRVVRSSVRKTDATMHAAGGLGTSIDDFARWASLQLGRGRLGGERVLGEESFEEMLAPQSRVSDGGVVGTVEGFGLGWQRGTYRGHPLFGHGGGYVGSASWVGFLPELDLGLAILATGGDGAGEMLRLTATDVLERFLSDDTLADLLPELLRSRRAASARARSTEEASIFTPSCALGTGGPWHNEWMGTLRFDPDRALAHLGGLVLRAADRDGGFVLASEGISVEGRFLEEEGRAVGAELDMVNGPVRFE